MRAWCQFSTQAQDSTTTEQANLLNVIPWVAIKPFLPLLCTSISAEGKECRTAVETLSSPTVLKYPL